MFKATSQWNHCQGTNKQTTDEERPRVRDREREKVWKSVRFNGYGVMKIH